MLEEIDDATFDEKTSGGVCLVLFYKDPCPFCKGMKAAVGKFSARHPELRTLQIDGEKNPASAVRLGVERFPDLFFFRDGSQAARHRGLGNPGDLEKLYAGV